MQRRVDVHPAELVAQHLELPRRSVDRQIADAQLVRAEAAVDVERMAVGVFDVQRLDRHAIRRELRGQPPVLVLRTGVDDEEAGIGHVDPSVEMRIARGADDVDVERDRAADIRDDGRQAFEQPKVDGYWT